VSGMQQLTLVAASCETLPRPRVQHRGTNKCEKRPSTEGKRPVAESVAATADSHCDRACGRRGKRRWGRRSSNVQRVFSFFASQTLHNRIFLKKNPAM